jgi:hypothetical protein
MTDSHHLFVFACHLFGLLSRCHISHVQLSTTLSAPCAWWLAPLPFLSFTSPPPPWSLWPHHGSELPLHHPALSHPPFAIVFHICAPHFQSSPSMSCFLWPISSTSTNAGHEVIGRAWYLSSWSITPAHRIPHLILSTRPQSPKHMHRRHAAAASTQCLRALRIPCLPSMNCYRRRPY